MDLRYNLLINGVDQTAIIKNKLTSFSINDNEGIELDSLFLSINNSDNKIIPPQNNAKLELKIGFGKPVSMGEFIVQFVEHNHGTILLKAIAQDLAKGRIKQTRVFEQQPLSNVLNTIAKSLGLNLKLGTTLLAKQIPYLLQSNQSDLSLLAELGELFYAIASIKDNSLVFIAKDTPQPPIILTNDNDINNITRKDSHYKIYNGVKANYWDIKTATNQVIRLGAEPYLLVPTIYALELTKELVKAKYKQIQEKSIIEITIKGNPELQAGLILNLPVTSKYQDFTGNYKITNAKHGYDGTGYLTSVMAYKM